jgi:hypothetical protein
MKLRLLIVLSALGAVACGNVTAREGGNVAGPDASLAALPWTGFYEKAGTEFAAGRRDEAVTLFYIGQLRGRVVVQCQQVQPDREPALLASLNATVGQTINEYAGGSPDGWAAAIDRALAFDAEHPDPNAASPACRAERDRQRAGLAQLRDHVRDNADDIRRQRSANGLPNR